jgi:peptidoglycan/LPS O-acetylase OafA/YrhL
VAVVLVVAFHAGLPISGGFVGVDVFFVISGFVIAAMLLRQLERDVSSNLRSFYTRRLRRLLPALAVLLVFVAIASPLLSSPFGPQQATAKTGFAASWISANLQLARVPGGDYFGLAADTNPLLHTWSLSVEEQFYLVFPALLLGVWPFRARLTTRWTGQRTVGMIVLAATVASFALSCYASLFSSSKGDANFAFYSPLTRTWEFGVGVLLALGAPAICRRTRRISFALGVIGATSIGVGACVITDTTAFPGVAALLPVVGAGLIVVAGMSPSRGVTSLLALRPAVWVGDISYGWYLWHWPLIVFTAAVWPGNRSILALVAVGSLVPTWLSYRFVENPIRFNDSLTGRRMVILVAVCVGLPGMAFLSLRVVNGLEQHSDAVKAFAAATRFHTVGPSGCDNTTLVGEQACTWSVDQPRGSIYLVGDSNAGQFAEPAAAAANAKGYDLTIGTRTGCPFADLIRQSRLESGLDGPACYRFVSESVALLQQSRPALVIVAMSASQVMDPHDGLYLRDPHSGEVATTPAAKAKLWEDGLARVLVRLNDAGIPTLVVHTIPNHFGPNHSFWQAETCPAINIWAHWCGSSLDRVSVERQQRLAREAENRAVAKVTRAASVDFTDDVCSPELCATQRNGVWMYRDATHLSVDGALMLTDRFRQLIDRHADGRDPLARGNRVLNGANAPPTLD